MTLDNDNKPVEPKLPDSIKSIMVTEPERPDDSESSGESGGYSAGFSDDAENTASISDFKSLLNALNPKIKDARLNEILQTGRVSRIFPDNYLDKFALIVALMTLEQDPNKPFDFAGIVMHTQDSLSFGYEGRGIADLLEAFGAVKEQEANNLANDLGMGS